MTCWSDGTTLDDQLVASWHRLKPERQRIGKLVVALSWLRKYPVVYRRVIATDTDAASIVVRHGWATAPAPMPTADEIAHVEQSARRAIEAIHAARIGPVVVPLRAAAATIPTQTKRGPVVDA